MNQAMNIAPGPKTFINRNIGAITSQAVDKKRITVINHFNKFLSIHHEENADHHPYVTFEGVVQDKEYMEEDEDMLGAFGDFLSMGRVQVKALVASLPSSPCSEMITNCIYGMILCLAVAGLLQRSMQSGV